MLPWENPDAIIEYRSALADGRPYFGTVCQADQGSRHHRCFSSIVSLVKRLRQDTGSFRILEIGSWAGSSLAAWDIASGRAAAFTVVDTWRPYLPIGPDLYDMMSKVAESEEIYNLFLHNVCALGLKPRLEIYREESFKVLPHLKPCYDVVYVDGSHAYRQAKWDIELSKSLLLEGGVLCGDDLDIQLDQLDPDEHREVLERNEDAGISRSGISYHAGVTQAVYECFGRVKTVESFWAVQKIGSDWVDVGERL